MGISLSSDIPYYGKCNNTGNYMLHEDRIYRYNFLVTQVDETIKLLTTLINEAECIYRCLNGVLFMLHEQTPEAKIEVKQNINNLSKECDTVLSEITIAQTTLSNDKNHNATST